MGFPLIWYGTNAKLLPTGTILKSDGTPIAGNSFATIQPDSGTSPVASSVTDTLIITSSDKAVNVNGNSGTKTIDLKNPASVTPAALAVDWSAGNLFSKSLSADSTFTFSNTSEKTIVMVVTMSGSHTVTWPTVKWAAGTAPTQTVSGTDVYTFVKIGSTIYGSVVQAMA